MKLPEHVAEVAKRLRPLGDRVFWYRAEYQHPTLAVSGAKTHRGWVVAVGPGRRLRIKTRANIGEHYAPRWEWVDTLRENGKFQPTTVKVGDFLEFSQYGQTEFTFEGIKFLSSGEKSVLGYADPDDTQGVMFHTPAGWAEEDKHRESVATVTL